jgi:hypothetical protein
VLRLLGPLVLIIALVVLARAISHGARDVAARRRYKNPSGTSYEWERRTEQVSRRVKGVSLPGEDREAILAFVSSHPGVEAYMEPKTLTHPLSTVLVAEDGEWHRYQLRDDSLIRELARSHGLQVFDAAKVGYPERMRRYKRPRPDEGGEPTPS